MGIGGSNTDLGNVAVYAELRPIERHRAFIDHLFVLKDRGRLAGAGRSLFASPFSEIVLVGRCPDHSGEDNDTVLAWKAMHLPPRFGRRQRRHDFHGWMLGVRCRPLDRDTGAAALVGSPEFFGATIEGNSARPFDSIIGALDAWIEHLRPRLDAAAATGPDLDRGTGIAALAASAGVVPRTLQRHFHKRTGLAPKRYAAVRRFNDALQRVFLGQESLAHIAAQSGYCDQAHLTMDLGRHAGLSPARLRALARRQVARDAVRFFKDAALQDRVRLLVCDDSAAEDEAGDGGIRSEGCKLRGAGPHELRAPDRDGDAGH